MILDTSVLYDSLVDAPMSDVARALLVSGELIRAPDLIRIEMASALTRAVRRKELLAEQVRVMFSRVDQLMPALDPSAPLIARAFTLSLELTHPVADCVFLAHAEARGDRLVTCDHHLVRKLAGTPHARLASSLADWRGSA